VRFVSNLNFLERLVIDESRDEMRGPHARTLVVIVQQSLEGVHVEGGRACEEPTPQPELLSLARVPQSTSAKLYGQRPMTPRC
jgi:hypothetical protein